MTANFAFLREVGGDAKSRQQSRSFLLPGKAWE